MNKLNREKIIEKLKKALAKQPIRLAYLFGSFAKGNTHPKSDIDIAVVLESGSDKRDYQIGCEVHSKLGKGVPEIDVREIKENTDPLFLANVLNPAMPLFVKDENERIRFEVKAFQRYDDTEKIREIFHHYALKRENEGIDYKTPCYQRIY